MYEIYARNLCSLIKCMHIVIGRDVKLNAWFMHKCGWNVLKVFMQMLIPYVMQLWLAGFVQVIF